MAFSEKVISSQINVISKRQGRQRQLIFEGTARDFSAEQITGVEDILCVCRDSCYAAPAEKIRCSTKKKFSEPTLKNLT